MQIYHLNCGSMREVDPAGAGPGRPARALNHCLLAETDSAGLVLVETGFGSVDIERPEESLGRTFLDRTQSVLEPGETAARQIARLGRAPGDVRHIVPTHLDLDHAGGLPDCPEAVVHVHVLPPSLSGDLAAALHEHGSATVDEHYCHSRQALPMPGLRWRHHADRSSTNAA